MVARSPPSDTAVSTWWIAQRRTVNPADSSLTPICTPPPASSLSSMMRLVACGSWRITQYTGLAGATRVRRMVTSGACTMMDPVTSIASTKAPRAVTVRSPRCVRSVVPSGTPVLPGPGRAGGAGPRVGAGEPGLALGDGPRDGTGGADETGGG